MADQTLNQFIDALIKFRDENDAGDLPVIAERDNGDYNEKHFAGADIMLMQFQMGEFTSRDIQWMQYGPLNPDDFIEGTDLSAVQAGVLIGVR